MNYQEDLAGMETEIHRLGALRNAQTPNTDHWWHYQDRITQLTGDMRALEAAMPVLEAADREVQRAKRAMDAAQVDADAAMDTVWRVVKWFGVAGLAGVVVSLLWTPTVWLPVLSGVALAVSGGAIWWGIRIRPARYAAVDDATGGWVEARTRRELLDARLTADPAPAPPKELPAALRLAIGPVDVEDAELVD